MASLTGPVAVYRRFAGSAPSTVTVVVVTTVLALVTLLAAPPGEAAPEPTRGSAASSAASPTSESAPASSASSASSGSSASSATVPPTMVVLDASGSMTEEDAGGQSRMDAAKEATNGLVDELGQDAPLGLVTYGTGTGNAPEDKDAGCRDISVVRGPTPGDTSQFTQKVDGLVPRGYTPIGEALRAAAEQLPSEGARTIVLVSDGIDTCAPPPVCEVAKELKDKGVDLVVNTVGLLVDDEARSELSCIADATGGTYADAGDAASLGEEMSRAATRTYNAYTSQIGELPGTETYRDAPEVPKGEDVGERFGATDDGTNQITFRTDLAPEVSEDEPSEQFWRVPVTDGERLAVAVNTTQPPAVDTLDLGQQEIKVSTVPVEDPDFESMLSGCDNPLLWDASDSHPTGMVTAGTATTAVGDDRCETGELLVRVTRGGDWKQGEDVPAEVTLTRFGAVSDAGDKATRADPTAPETVPEDLDGVAAAQVSPGTWYDDATDLPTDGSAVETTIVPGEQQFYRLPVGYGQKFTSVLDVTDLPEAGDFHIGDELALGVRNDARQVVVGGGSVGAFYEEDSGLQGFSTPVTFGNRFGGDGGYGEASADVGSVWLNGAQYLVVTLERHFADNQIDENSRQVPVTYRLAAEVSGTEQDGPEFAPLDWPDGDTPSSTASGDGTSTEADGSSGGDDSGLPWGVIALGAAVVVVLAGGAALALRRR